MMTELDRVNLSIPEELRGWVIWIWIWIWRRRMRRERCTRCCLQRSARVVNMAVNTIGVGMIIYSLWLFKKWDEGVSQLSASSRSQLPTPWFIVTCLGVGMVACLTTICGCTAMNRTKHSVLCIYIASICSLVLLQAAVIVAIFFDMDLVSKIAALIDENHVKFRSFIIFHIHVCRLLTIVVLVAQINLAVLAVTMLVVGLDPTHHSRVHLLASVPDFRYSFLISPNSPVTLNAPHPIIPIRPLDALTTSALN